MQLEAVTGGVFSLLFHIHADIHHDAADTGPGGAQINTTQLETQYLQDQRPSVILGI